MQESVEYGNSRINFIIKRSSRKSLGISVLSCGAVVVTAPEGASVEKIKEKIIKRGSWLLEQRRLTRNNPVTQPQKEIITGESYFYLGRHYRLKVFRSNYDSVDILDDRLILNCQFPEEKEFKRSILLNWYQQKAIDIITRQFNKYCLVMNRTEVNIVVRKLTKNWGEYHPNRKLIVFNSELVVAPIHCIDYVIIHELCHTTYSDHNSEFYNLLFKYLPNWKSLKMELENCSNGFSSLIGNKA